MKTIKILSTLLCIMLLAVLPATAQNTDNKNKAIIEANDGSHELNTDDIQAIRFDGGKITIEQPWGNTTYDRTLRSLSFQRPNPNTVRLTATTTIGTEGGTNRAQTIDGGNLKSTWESGDVVYVYPDASTTENIGTLTPKTYGSSSATLTGNINATGLSNNQTLYFSTKDRATLDLSSQDGTVESLFYFTATGTVSIVGANATISNLTFERPIAVVKFTLNDKADGTSPVYATSLTVNDGTNNYSITPASIRNVFYVGIPTISSKTVTLTATDGFSSYNYEKASVTFANNNYYAINVKMTNNTNYLTIPLTFEAKTAGAVVSFSSSMDTTPTIEYSLNGGAWTTYSSGITLTNIGDKVSFRGNNAAYASSYYKYSSFSCTKDCYLYGNIMSLTSKEGFASATSLTENYAFCRMFYNNTCICDHASKTLKLPATTLTEWCYYILFRGCSQLTKAPELPATILADYCYANMFASCSGLATAPELPAINLAKECYTGMFSSCTGLKVAPALPATTMAIRCYYTMFSGCTGLTSAPVLPAMTLATDCYYGMFWGCTGLASGPALPATTLEEGCYWCMFYNCSNLVSAPALPATTMKKLCYYSMFEGCSKLTTPPSLPATTMAEECYGYMFRGCSELQSAPTLPATSMVKDCYYGMFYNCSNLVSAPALPATSLAESCYAYMFYNCTSLASSPVLSVSNLYNKEYFHMFDGCSSLSTVTCLATYVGGSGVSSWLNGVAASGTFYKAESSTVFSAGGSYGPPSGWTIENYVPGALSGKFTINAGGTQVKFSQGNLRALYKNSTWSWELAPHQWDFVGDASANININGNGTVGVGGFYVDLFGWVGASSDWTGAAQYGISNSTATNSKAGYGNVADEALKSDWGNTIGTGWRTLTKDEWVYLFYTRTVNGGTGNGKSYTLGQSVNGKLGIVIYPDNYTGSVYSGSDWASFEAAGCVFLPAAGYRSQAAVYSAGSIGYYWSSTPSSADNAYSVYFNSGNLYPAYNSNRSYGSSVRLVRQVE